MPSFIFWLKSEPFNWIVLERLDVFVTISDDLWLIELSIQKEIAFTNGWW